jgi:hypothetical protein
LVKEFQLAEAWLMKLISIRSTKGGERPWIFSSPNCPWVGGQVHRLLSVLRVAVQHHACGVVGHQPEGSRAHRVDRELPAVVLHGLAGHDARGGVRQRIEQLRIGLDEPYL